MIGDKVISKPHHRSAAKLIFSALKDGASLRRTILSIAGESGSGKSEIAHELAKLFNEGGIPTVIFQQDDYFFHPPKTNHAMRLEDINHVGLGEVNLSLLDEHLKRFKFSTGKPIEKPLVIFDQDRITEEKITPSDYSLLIVEGTYTTLLKNVDYRIFIDRDFRETLGARMERSRDPIDSFSEKVLQIEHSIISKHKKLACIIVEKDYSVTMTRDLS